MSVTLGQFSPGQRKSNAQDTKSTRVKSIVTLN